MKKSMASAYTDMMTNLAKSTVTVPLHLQGAKEALAWWESSDSLLAKSSVAEESDEAYEEDEARGEHKGDDRPHPDAASDIHGGHEADEAPEDDEGEDDEADESADDEDEEDMQKAIAGLRSLSKSYKGSRAPSPDENPHSPSRPMPNPELKKPANKGQDTVPHVTELAGGGKPASLTMLKALHELAAATVQLQGRSAAVQDTLQKSIAALDRLSGK